MRLTKTKNNYKKLSSRKNKVKRSKKVRGGGTIFGKQSYNILPNFESKQIKIVAFDVDETLSAKGQKCGGNNHGIGIGEQRKKLIKLLKKLQKAGVKLYIITRCRLNGNILNDDNKLHYKDILKLMDGAFGADQQKYDNKRIPTGFSGSGINGGSYWAHIKPFVLDKIREKLGGDISADQVMLVDDDTENARIASQRGYHAITTQGEKKGKGGGIDMTIFGLEDLIVNGLTGDGLTGDLTGKQNYKYESPKDDEHLPEILTQEHKDRITEKVNIYLKIFTQKQLNKFKQKADKNSQKIKQKNKLTRVKLNTINNNLKRKIKEYSKKKWYRYRSKNKRLKELNQILKSIPTAEDNKDAIYETVESPTAAVPIPALPESEAVEEIASEDEGDIYEQVGSPNEAAPRPALPESESEAEDEDEDEDDIYGPI